MIVALKAHSVPGLVDRMQPLLGPDTTVVFAVNGVPWWYFHRLQGPFQDRRLASVDPGDRQWNGIGPERALGCVVYPAAEVVEPGVVEHVAGDRFVLGEPSGEISERAQRLARLLVASGLKAPVRPRIRDEIWVKLWGNLSFNPISALTGATLDVITSDPGTRAVARAMMLEAQAIGDEAGRALRDRRRPPDRGCGRDRRAQDLDAPGPRARPADGDRRPGQRRPGDGPPRRRAHAHAGHRARLGGPARQAGRLLLGRAVSRSAASPSLPAGTA